MFKTARMSRTFLTIRAQGSKHRGFTLIEVMVVVAIIAILSAIAFPSYEAYVRKTRRTDAKSALLELATREEKYYSINNKYTQTASDLGYSAFPSAVYSSGSSFYDLSVSGTATTFTATATPKGSQSRDADCYAFTIDQSGNKGNKNSTTTLNANKCW